MHLLTNRLCHDVAVAALPCVYESLFISSVIGVHIALPQFPEALEQTVCRLAHHSTELPEELLSRLVDALAGGFTLGEVVLGTHEGQTLPCRIIAVERRPDGDAEQVGLATASPAALSPKNSLLPIRCCRQPADLRGALSVQHGTWCQSMPYAMTCLNEQNVHDHGTGCPGLRRRRVVRGGVDH